MTAGAFIACCVAFAPHLSTAFAPPPTIMAKRRNGRLRALFSSSSPSTSTSTASTSTYDLVVIGGGSAGLTAAKFAANFDKSVCLVESSRVGGDCTWTGCVPSKTLLAGAKRARTWRLMNEQYGDSNSKDGGIDDASLRRMLRGLKEQVDENRERIYEEDDSPAVLKSLGIELATGKARFRDARTVDVTNDADGTTCRLDAKFGVVVATGASPRDPTSDIAGLDSVPFWTYENVWEEFFSSVEKTPKQQVREKRVIVVGGGPIGCELSQAIARLGCCVTLVSRSTGLLPEAEMEASEELRTVMEKEGISIICNHGVSSVSSQKNDQIMVSLDSQETILGDHILLATGRVPNVGNMNLKDIGVQIDSRTNGIRVDEKLQTSVKGVYAAGDCTGDRQFTHYAGYQGAIAARNILLPLKDPGVLSDVPSTTFTDPEVASFGLAERNAVERYGEGAVSTSFRPLAKIDRAICEGTEAHGFIKIVYQTKTKQILGATIMAPAAGELISELAVARDGKVSFDRLATVMHSYPSYSIALQQMAADVYYDKLKKNRGLYDVLKKLGL